MRILYLLLINFFLIVITSPIYADIPDIPVIQDTNLTEFTIGDVYLPILSQESDLKAELISTTDLAIAGSITPKTVEMGFPISASIFVVNTGPAEAKDVQIDYYIINSDQNQTYSYPIWLHQKTTDSIPPFYRDNVPFTATMPGGIEPGEYSLYATIKTDTTDRNLTNNLYSSSNKIDVKSSIQSDVTGFPDLSLTLDHVQPIITAPGYPLTINYTVRNTGNKISGTYHIGFFLSSNLEITPADIKIWDDVSYYSYPGMIQNGSSQNIIPETVPPGEYYLGAIVDFTNMVQERDEANNNALYRENITIQDRAPPIDDVFLQTVSGYIAVKTNLYRNYLGLSELQYDKKLGDIAVAHSNDMAKRDYFSHENPEGMNPSDRADAAHYDTHTWLSDGTERTGIAENIVKISSGHSVGKGFSGFVDPSDPEAVADVMLIEWILSPEHNINLINPEIDKIGVGVVYDGEYFFGTQNLI